MTLVDRNGTDVAALRERFGEQRFLPEGGFVLRQGQPLPSLVWEHPEWVTSVLDDLTIPTRWFDEHCQEIRAAHQPGRYYAYGEAPAPDGSMLCRAMTCCCVREIKELALLAERLVPSLEHASDPNHRRAQIERTVRYWHTSEKGAVTLSALLEAGPEGSGY